MPKSKQSRKLKQNCKQLHKNTRNKDKLYIVEAILDKKFHDNEWKYLIKWEGWPKSQASWEPIENLSNVLDMLEEFEANLPKNNKINAEISVHNDTQPKISESSKNDENPEGNIIEPIRESIQSKSKIIESSEIGKIQLDTLLKKNSFISLSKRAAMSAQHISVLPELKLGLHNKKKKVTNHNEIEPKNMLDIKLEQPIHGHFRFGDKPKRIISAKSQEPYVICLIEWEPRSDGILPLRTNLTNKEIKQYDPMLLLDFYESRLKFGNPNNANETNVYDSANANNVIDSNDVNYAHTDDSTCNHDYNEMTNQQNNMLTEINPKGHVNKKDKNKPYKSKAYAASMIEVNSNN